MLLHDCLSNVLAWVFKSYTDDLTLLGVLFTINAGLSVVDSITAKMTDALREEIKSEIAKFEGENWLKVIAPEETDSDKAIRSKLKPLVDGVVRMKEEIPSLFNDRSAYWKNVMTVVAAFLLACMAIPYTARILLLSVLTLPLMQWSFSREKNEFIDRFKEAAERARETFRTIQEGSTTKETDSDAISEKLSGPEGVIAASTGTP